MSTRHLHANRATSQTQEVTIDGSASVHRVSPPRPIPAAEESCHLFRHSARQCRTPFRNVLLVDCAFKFLSTTRCYRLRYRCQRISALHSLDAHTGRLYGQDSCASTIEKITFPVPFGYCEPVKCGDATISEAGSSKAQSFERCHTFGNCQKIEFKRNPSYLHPLVVFAP